MRDIFYDELEHCWENSAPLSDEAAYALYEFVDALMQWVDRLYYPQVKAYIEALSERPDVPDDIIDEEGKPYFKDDIPF